MTWRPSTWRGRVGRDLHFRHANLDLGEPCLLVPSLGAGLDWTAYWALPTGSAFVVRRIQLRPRWPPHSAESPLSAETHVAAAFG